MNESEALEYALLQVQDDKEIRAYTMLECGLKKIERNLDIVVEAGRLLISRNNLIAKGINASYVIDN